MNRREGIPAALLLALALGAAFGPDIVRGEVLFIRVVEDTNNLFSFYPWNIFSARCFHSGLFPLFNPLNACGVPHLANYQSAPLYPLHLLLFIHPVRAAFDMLLLLRLFLLGYGTYLLVRKLGMGFAAGIGAMLAAAFNGYYMRYAAMVHLNVEVLLPWAMLLAMAVNDRRRLRYWAAFTGLMAAGLLGGNAESAFFLVLLVLLWVLWIWIPDRGTGLFLVIAGIIVSCLLASGQVLPFLEYLPHAWHIHPSGSGHEWLDARGIIGLAAPNLFGLRVGFAPYAGAAVLSLAVIGSARDRNSWFFFGLAVFLFVLIYGPPGTRWMAHLPGLSRTASYKYAFAPLGIVMAILAGRGLDGIEKGEIAAARVRRATAYIGAFVAFFVLGGWIAGRQMTLFSAAAAVLSLAAVATNISLKKHSVYAVCAVLWVELMAHFIGLHPRVLVDPDLLGKTPQVAYLSHNKETGRVAASIESGFLPNLNLLWGISDVGLFDALYPKAYVEQMSKALGFDMANATEYFKTHGYYFPISPQSDKSEVWVKLGVRYYLGRDLDQSDFPERAPFLREDLAAYPTVESNGLDVGPITSGRWSRRYEPSAGIRKLTVRYNNLPGWRAWVDGDEISVRTPGALFMGLDIPPGGGEVCLKYVPWGWKVGMWVSIVTLLFVFVAVFARKKEE